MGNTALNAFSSVRPRGVGLSIPTAKPRKTNTSAVPKQGNVHLLLDRNGRRTVSLEPRAKGSITIENRERGQASTDKRRAISPRGTK